MKQDLKSIVLSFGADLGLDDTDRSFKCPQCGNGKGDFCITRLASGLVYRCWRIKCDFKGFINSDPGDWFPTKINIKNNLRYPYENDLENLSPVAFKYLSDTFNLELSEVRSNHILWCPRTNRVVYSVLSKAGSILGYVARIYKDLHMHKLSKDTPKAKTYWINKKDTTPSLAFPYHKPLNYVNKNYVLVEDIPSAIRIARHVPSVALLGNRIPENSLNFLSAYHIFIILDADATSQSIALAKKYSLFFQSCKIIAIDLDPKNMSEDALRKNIIDKIV